MAFVMLLLVAVAGGLFLHAARHQRNMVRRGQASDQCLLDAQSALEQVKHELVQTFSDAGGSLSWFDTWNINSIGSDPVYSIPNLVPINGSDILVTIAGVDVITNAGYAEVELIGAAARSVPFAVSRIISEKLRIQPSAGNVSLPFDYAYFLNKNATLRGNMIINGDVRANANLRLSPKSYVNGSRISADRIMANSPTLSISKYRSSANVGSAARPTSPTADNGTIWPMGYEPDRSKLSSQAALPIPFIGSIDELAGSAAGRIIQNGVNIAAGFYSGAGPDGLPNTADDGCLILDGSSSPITVEGSVVIKGDLIIRGRVLGQGVIYAGRNVHIVGDLSYLNPPSWPKPDSNPHQTAEQNATKDILVLAAKGNIVVGDYTAVAWSKRVWGIMADPANISPYSVSESDAAIGYDSDKDPNNGYLFSGKYFDLEANNGRRLSGAGTNTVQRRYYESSLSHSTFSSLCGADVPGVNAALFSNHGIIGDIGSSARKGKRKGNSLLNGAMVCNDDLLNFYGLFFINWDIRLGSSSYDRINSFYGTVSTGSAAVATTTGWREIY